MVITYILEQKNIQFTYVFEQKCAKSAYILEQIIVNTTAILIPNISMKKNLSHTLRLYNALTESFKTDVEKYAKNNTQKQVTSLILWYLKLTTELSSIILLIQVINQEK